jgi:hypothetical protein
MPDGVDYAAAQSMLADTDEIELDNIYRSDGTSPILGADHPQVRFRREITGAGQAYVVQNQLPVDTDALERAVRAVSDRILERFADTTYAAVCAEGNGQTSVDADVRWRALAALACLHYWNALGTVDDPVEHALDRLPLDVA